MSEFKEYEVTANGIRQHVTEAGEGPVVLLCHGFPELGYSWRHQLRALAGAGYRAIAPDMRGYGGTEIPGEIGNYTVMWTLSAAPAERWDGMIGAEGAFDAFSEPEHGMVWLNSARS